MWVGVKKKIHKKIYLQTVNFPLILVLSWTIYGVSDVWQPHHMVNVMKKSGSNTGKDGGIFQEVGPRGGKRENFAAVPDNKPLPPTSEAGNGWVRVKRTPDSKR